MPLSLVTTTTTTMSDTDDYHKDDYKNDDNDDETASLASLEIAACGFVVSPHPEPCGYVLSPRPDSARPKEQPPPTPKQQQQSHRRLSSTSSSSKSNDDDKKKPQNNDLRTLERLMSSCCWEETAPELATTQNETFRLEEPVAMVDEVHGCLQGVVLGLFPRPRDENEEEKDDRIVAVQLTGPSIGKGRGGDGLGSKANRRHSCSAVVVRTNALDENNGDEDDDLFWPERVVGRCNVAYAPVAQVFSRTAMRGPITDGSWTNGIILKMLQNLLREHDETLKAWSAPPLIGDETERELKPEQPVSAVNVDEMTKKKMSLWKRLFGIGRKKKKQRQQRQPRRNSTNTANLPMSNAQQPQSLLLPPDLQLLHGLLRTEQAFCLADPSPSGRAWSDNQKASSSLPTIVYASPGWSMISSQTQFLARPLTLDRILASRYVNEEDRYHRANPKTQQDLASALATVTKDYRTSSLNLSLPSSSNHANEDAGSCHVFFVPLCCQDSFDGRHSGNNHGNDAKSKKLKFVLCITCPGKDETHHEKKGVIMMDESETTSTNVEEQLVDKQSKANKGSNVDDVLLGDRAGTPPPPPPFVSSGLHNSWPISMQFAQNDTLNDFFDAGCMEDENAAEAQVQANVETVPASPTKSRTKPKSAEAHKSPRRKKHSKIEPSPKTPVRRRGKSLEKTVREQATPSRKKGEGDGLSSPVRRRDASLEKSVREQASPSRKTSEGDGSSPPVRRRDTSLETAVRDKDSSSFQKCEGDEKTSPQMSPKKKHIKKSKGSKSDEVPPSPSSPQKKKNHHGDKKKKHSSSTKKLRRQSAPTEEQQEKIHIPTRRSSEGSIATKSPRRSSSGRNSRTSSSRSGTSSTSATSNSGESGTKNQELSLADTSADRSFMPKNDPSWILSPSARGKMSRIPEFRTASRDISISDVHAPLFDPKNPHDPGTVHGDSICSSASATSKVHSHQMGSIIAGLPRSKVVLRDVESYTTNKEEDCSDDGDVSISDVHEVLYKSKAAKDPGLSQTRHDESSLQGSSTSLNFHEKEEEEKERSPMMANDSGAASYKRSPNQRQQMQQRRASDCEEDSSDGDVSISDVHAVLYRSQAAKDPGLSKTRHDEGSLASVNNDFDEMNSDQRRKIEGKQDPTRTIAPKACSINMPTSLLGTDVSISNVHDYLYGAKKNHEMVHPADCHSIALDAGL